MQHDHAGSPSKVRRSLFDYVLAMTSPRVTAGRDTSVSQLWDGVWSLDFGITLPGGPSLPSRGVAVELSQGGLAVISAPPLSDAVRALCRERGPVRAVIAPNSFHYLYHAGFAAEHPAARCFAAPALTARTGHLALATELTDAAPSELAQDFDLAVLGPVRLLSEVLIFHRSSRTLILTDLGFHLVDVTSAPARLFWRAFGIPAAFGPSRTARLTLLRDREAARPALRRALEWDFRRILVAHGSPVETNARSEFERAYARWLA
jgi:hypothetical protein